jgi:hypothetical protein
VRDPVEIVEEQIRAYARGDTAAFVATYEPDAVCAELPSGRIKARGQAEIARLWGALFEGGPRKVNIPKRIVQGRFVTDYEHIVVERSGRTVEGVAIYLVGPDAIRNVWFLVEPTEGDAG